MNPALRRKLFQVPPTLVRSSGPPRERWPALDIDALPAIRSNLKGLISDRSAVSRLGAGASSASLRITGADTGRMATSGGAATASGGGEGPGPFRALRCADGASEVAYSYLQGALPAIMFLPGFGSSMEGLKAQALEAFACGAGRAMVRFDYRGHGRSGGAFTECTLGDWIQDALLVLDKVLGPEAPVVLVGSSMGGWIALHLCLQRPARVRGLVGVATAADFLERRWQAMDEGQRAALRRDGVEVIPTKYENFSYTITMKMIEEGRNHRLLDRAAIPITCPMRLIHGMDDADVPWQVSAEVLQKVASEDANLLLIKGGDHRLSSPSELSRLTDVVGALLESISE